MSIIIMKVYGFCPLRFVLLDLEDVLDHSILVLVPLSLQSEARLKKREGTESHRHNCSTTYNGPSEIRNPIIRNRGWSGEFWAKYSPVYHIEIIIVLYYFYYCRYQYYIRRIVR